MSQCIWLYQSSKISNLNANQTNLRFSFSLEASYFSTWSTFPFLLFLANIWKATELKEKWTERLCNVWKVCRTIAAAPIRSALMCSGTAPVLDAAGWRLFISPLPSAWVPGGDEQKLLTCGAGRDSQRRASQLIKGRERQCLMNGRPDHHRLSHLLWRRPGQR